MHAPRVCQINKDRHGVTRAEQTTENNAMVWNYGKRSGLGRAHLSRVEKVFFTVCLPKLIEHREVVRKKSPRPPRHSLILHPGAHLDCRFLSHICDKKGYVAIDKVRYMYSCQGWSGVAEHALSRVMFPPTWPKKAKPSCFLSASLGGER